MKCLDILPECYVDTNLVETILGADSVNHQKGCNNVTNVMTQKLDKDFALGVIDKDKRKPTYVNEFECIGKCEHFELFRHPVKNHFILMIVPAIESFILDVASGENVDIGNYGLPTGMKAFKDETKSIGSKSDNRFRKLFRDLSGSKEFLLLRNIFDYLLSHRYDADNTELKALFV